MKKHLFLSLLAASLSLVACGKNKEPDFSKFREFCMGETRFSQLPKVNPAHAEELLQKAERCAKERWERIKKFGL